MARGGNAAECHTVEQGSQPFSPLTLLRPVLFEDFAPKRKNRSHMALHERNSGAECCRELFKGSNDSASLLVRIEKKFLVRWCRFFLSNVISGGLLGHLGPRHLALDPNC